MIRDAVVAGSFYPKEKSALLKLLAAFVDKDSLKMKAKGIVAPHAGYMYSGKPAGAVFSVIEIPSRIILLGPNHHGRGADLAVYASGAWRTPLGEVPIEEELAQTLLNECSLLKDDTLAHLPEHSLEVQLPFLQYLNPKVSIVPICVGNIQDINILAEVGQAIGKAVSAQKEDVLIIASSDMTHYESKKSAAKKDRLAIDAVLDLNEEALFRVVIDHNISMCGVLPTVIMLSAVKQLSPQNSQLIAYTNSGEVTGSFEEVVAYASIVIS